MANAIIECDLLEGRTEDEVRALLGPPTRDFGREHWYFIATSIDDEFLAVRYDAQGRVVEVERVMT